MLSLSNSKSEFSPSSTDSVLGPWASTGSYQCSCGQVWTRITLILGYLILWKTSAATLCQSCSTRGQAMAQQTGDVSLGQPWHSVECLSSVVLDKFNFLLVHTSHAKTGPQPRSTAGGICCFLQKPEPKPSCSPWN